MSNRQLKLLLDLFPLLLRRAPLNLLPQLHANLLSIPRHLLQPPPFPLCLLLFNLADRHHAAASQFCEPSLHLRLLLHHFLNAGFELRQWDLHGTLTQLATQLLFFCFESDCLVTETLGLAVLLS